MKQPIVTVRVSPDSIIDALVAWRVSRPKMGDNEADETTIRAEMVDMKENHKDEYDALLFEVLSMDLPVREYVKFTYVFLNVPRAFLDQEDRTRLAAHWQRSLRVLDLSRFARNGEYFTPDAILNDVRKKNIYEQCMVKIEDTYNELIALGLNRDLARGVIPMHIYTAGTTSCDLNTVLRSFIGKRACFFAQSTYWDPVVKATIAELQKHFPPKLIAHMVKLPCAGKDACPYMKDIMDRMYDGSNPICPVVIQKYLGKSSKNETAYIVENLTPEDLPSNTPFIVTDDFKVGIYASTAYKWSCIAFADYKEVYKNFIRAFIPDYENRPVD